MKILINLMLGALLLWPLSSEAIGRAGNGTQAVDSGLGFQTNIPQKYYGTRSYEDKSLRVYTNAIMGGNFVEIFLHLSSLNEFFPELATMGRDEANEWKEMTSGVPLNHPNPCVDLHLFESSTMIYGAAQWGPGKGVAIFAPSTVQTKQDVFSSLMDLELLDGACEWK